jgi:hypothetical protein
MRGREKFTEHSEKCTDRLRRCGKKYEVRMVVHLINKLPEMQTSQGWMYAWIDKYERTHSHI